jgi:hypothetical protein
MRMGYDCPPFWNGIAFLAVIILVLYLAWGPNLEGPTHDSSGRHASGLTTGSPAEWLVQADFDSWQNRDMKREQNITLGEMRANDGPRLLIVYCADFKCSHSVIISSSLWPNHVRLSDLEPRFTCKACGRRGGDVRPLFGRAK